MSGICVLLQLEAEPRLDSADLDKMTAACAYRGPDGIQSWLKGNVGMGYLALNTTPESLRERQPLVSADGRLVLVADARVDNRVELTADLRRSGHLPQPDPTDADLILAAYQRWGEECPKQIIGDFAFVIWDEQRRRLFCARDPIGIRLLHYCRKGSRLFLATSVGAIVAALGDPPPVNDALIRSFLNYEFDRWVHETAYRGIYRLPPAHYLLASESGIVLKRYWMLGAQSGPRYQHDADYIAHFRDLLRQAVSARLRSAGPVALLVSGGLDSSSIACMSNHLLASGEVNVLVRMYSGIYRNLHEADERKYSEAVAQKCEYLKTTFVPLDDCWALREFANDAGYPLDEPEITVSRAALTKMGRLALHEGCAVLLMGVGGDQVLNGSAYRIPMLLRDVGIRRWPAELKYFCQRRHCFPISLLARAFLGPVLPVQLKRCLSTWTSKGGNTPLNPFPYCSQGRIANVLPPPPLSSQCARFAYRQLTEGKPSAHYLWLDTMAAHLRMEWRFPYLDRRLVDFVLSTPPRLCFQNGLHKYLLRQAMVGMLPELIRQRTSGSHFGAQEEKGLREKERQRILQLLKNPLLAQLGYVKEQSLLAAWNLYWEKGARAGTYRPLTAGLCVEAWLRKRTMLGPA